MPKPKDVIQDAPWMKLTHKIIGLAMEVHNELGPGHREQVYHDAMTAKQDLNTTDFFRPKKSRHFSERNGARASDKQPLRVIGWTNCIRLSDSIRCSQNKTEYERL